MDPHNADHTVNALELDGVAQLAISPREGVLNANVNPEAVALDQKKRCTFCIELLPASMFSPGQWNARAQRPGWRRQREPTASTDLKAAFAAFDEDGEPFTWRQCKRCAHLEKVWRGRATY